MCSGSEAGSYLRLIDFVYHSTLGLRVIKKKKKGMGVQSEPFSPHSTTNTPTSLAFISNLFAELNRLHLRVAWCIVYHSTLGLRVIKKKEWRAHRGS